MSASPPSEKQPRVAALDGLRGVAAVGVLLFHGGHLKGGYLGVDLFFVLSGYLITTLLLREWRERRSLRLGRFWGRRARRLLPALAILLVAVGIHSWLAGHASELNSIRADGIATIFYVANWHTIWVGNSYFQSGLAPSPFEHTWSLAIEEQFYLLWPLLVLFALGIRNRPSTILRISVAIAALSTAATVTLHLTGAVSDNALYLGTFTRIGSIAMGAALATWQISHRRALIADRKSAQALSLLAAAVLAVMWTQVDVSSGVLYAGGLGACGLAGAVLIATVTSPEPGLLGRALEWWPLRQLGVISYGLYLYHWPVILWLDQTRTGLSGWPLFGLQLFVAIDLAVLSYFLIEAPIRYGPPLRPGSRAIAIAGLATAVIALVAGTAGGIPAITYTGTGEITVGGPHDPRVLFVGDSVPETLAREGVAPLVKELHVTIANGGLIGCMPMRQLGPVVDLATGRVDRVKSDCTYRYPTLIKEFHPQIAVLMIGSLFNFNIRSGGRLLDQCDPAYEAASFQITEKQVATLSSDGAVVVLVTAPGITNKGLRGLFKTPDSMRRSACANDVIRKVVNHDSRTRLVDLASFVCPPGQDCIETVNGKPLRDDGIHERGPQAEYVARWLIPRVLAAARSSR